MAATVDAHLGARSAIERVRDYWNEHVTDWKVARHAPGTPAFFAETEAYRYSKLEYLAAALDFPSHAGRSLLDVGCGLGNDLARFAAAGARVTGVDLAPRAVALARRNFAQRGLAGEFAVMDGERLEFPDATFDVVYCHTVLHFTPDPAAMVREVRRVLRPDGLAILMIANRRSWMNVLRHVMHVEVDYEDAPVYRPRSLAEFRALLQPFRRVELRPERFPVPTLVHRGAKAMLYNRVFVGAFNALPRALTRPTGHHLLAYCRP